MGVASGLAAVGRARSPEVGRKDAHTEGTVPCLRGTLRGACDPLQRKARGPCGLRACLPTVHPLLPPLTRPHTHALVHLTWESPRMSPQLCPWLPLLIVQVSAQVSPKRGLPEASYLQEPPPPPPPPG